MKDKLSLYYIHADFELSWGEEEHIRLVLQNIIKENPEDYLRKHIPNFLGIKDNHIYIDSYTSPLQFYMYGNMHIASFKEV